MMVLTGVCKECKEPFEIPAGGWLMAHWSDRSVWPVSVTLPCGHQRKNIRHSHFSEK